MERKIDFAAKKTEAGWIRAIDSFAIAFTPKWYEFLNWIVLLGVFNFLSELTKDWRIELIYIISNLGLWYYLQAVFFNISIEGIPFIKADRVKRIFSLLIGGLITVGIYSLVESVVPMIGSSA